MRATIVALLVALGVGAAPVLAHTDKPGHHSHGPINKLEAEDAARGIVGDMVRQRAVEPSWIDAPIVGAERRTRDRRQEWVPGREVRPDVLQCDPHDGERHRQR